ncbi:MAG: iron chelate uptake ABC transporter family permease subunit [Pirellulaceae bacterium]
MCDVSELSAAPPTRDATCAAKLRNGNAFCGCGTITLAWSCWERHCWGWPPAIVGSFTLLRKRALMGDALSHATLPGIGLAFIGATLLGHDGKSLPLLLAGAAASGIVGMAAIVVIRSSTRLSEDTALGIVLSTFFGAGVAVLGISQRLSTGSAAGLESFIYGKTASMLSSDAWLIAAACLCTCIVAVLLFKELKLLCFDDNFAGSKGYPVLFLDSLLMAMVVVITIVGLQAVGLVLVIALLVTPAAAARFWTQKLTQMLLIAASLGAISGMFGSIASALFPQLPSGAMIVLIATALFMISMMLGPARGVGPRWVRRQRLNATIDRQHLLRGIFELLEAEGHVNPPPGETIPTVRIADLLELRSWSSRRLHREIRKAQEAGLVAQLSRDEVRATKAGYLDAARLTHEHRLWELYLITHAEVAPAQVDRDADKIEHVLKPEMIDRLERLLQQNQRAAGVAQSPHPLQRNRPSES